MSEQGTYVHRINVNIGGSGARPVVSLWCVDCLVVVRELDQVNSYTAMQQVVAEHCLEPSRREILTGTIPSTEGGAS